MTNIENLNKYLNEWKDKIHQHNLEAKWWPEQFWQEHENINLHLEKLQLVITEVSEATEGLRKNLMDDKLTHRKMVEVEMADALIRFLDYCGRFNYNIFIYEEDLKLNLEDLEKRNISEPAYHFMISGSIGKFWEGIWDQNVIIGSILNYGTHYGYDILSAMEEKFEFNKTRADHKIENRMKEGGKAF